MQIFSRSHNVDFSLRITSSRFLRLTYFRFALLPCDSSFHLLATYIGIQKMAACFA